MKNARKRTYLRVSALKPIHLLLIAVITVFITQSCYKDRYSLDKLKGGEWDPSVAAPIINSRLTMADIQELSEGIWGEDPNGVVSLIYRDTALTDVTTGFVNLPNQTSDSTFPFIMDPNMLPGDADNEWFTHTHYFNMPPSMTIDSMHFSGGTIDIEITTNINHDCRITVVVPALIKYGSGTGNNFVKTFDIAYDGNPTRTINVSYSVRDYALGLVNDGNGNWSFVQKVNVSSTMSTRPNNSPYSFKITEGLNDLEYHNVFGFFGQNQLNLTNGNIQIDLFKNNYIGSTVMEDAILRLGVSNSYGTDFDFVVDDVYVKRDNQKLNITSPLLPSLPLNGVPMNKYGDTMLTNYVFDPSNSNIVDAINLNPDEMFIGAHVISNPTWSTFNRNFISNFNEITVNAELEIPLHGRAMNFSISDTSDFSIDNIDEIKTFELRINTANLFPIEGTLQVFFADSNGVVLDSAFVTGESMILNPAPIGPAPDYRASTTANQTSVVSLEGSRLDNLYRMEKIIIKASISTLNNGNSIVKIYNDYYIDVVISSKADLHIEF